MIYQAVLVFVVTLVFTAEAYPTGAKNNDTNPMDAFSSFCTSGNFRPNHGNHLPQSTPSPFVITVSSPAGTIYSPGRDVTITIASEKPTRKFKGFFLQGDSTEASFVGNFTCGNQGHQVKFCGRDGATHSNAIAKELVVCRWSPPDFQIGHVQFTATIVENFSTFWTGVKSSTNLGPDPKVITWEQKSQQLRQQMMQQFQHQSRSFANMFSQQGGQNPFASMFSSGQNNENGFNPFAALGGGGNQGGNPFAGFMQQQQQSHGGLQASFRQMLGGQ